MREVGRNITTLQLPDKSLMDIYFLSGPRGQ